MENSIEVIEQKTVLFYDDELIAVRGGDGHIYVSLRHLCDVMGLARYTQVRKIRDNEILNEGYKGGFMMMPPSESGRGGGRQKAGLLRIDLIPMWLTTINISRVKDDIKLRIKQYQKEAAKVLWEAFQDGRLSVDPAFSELLKNESNPSVQAYKMAQAIMKMAQQQIVLEARVDSHEQRIEQLESVVGNTKHQITPSQASQISQAVKAIASQLGKRSKRNEYAGVYGELYRRFDITSYKQLPKNRFDEAMNFLTGWYSEVTDESDVPF